MSEQCKQCAEKDKEIEELKAEIADYELGLKELMGHTKYNFQKHTAEIKRLEKELAEAKSTRAKDFKELFAQAKQKDTYYEELKKLQCMGCEEVKRLKGEVDKAESLEKHNYIESQAEIKRLEGIVFDLISVGFPQEVWENDGMTEQEAKAYCKEHYGIEVEI